ncbi:MAG: cation transporter [Pelolinea sp.]|nr:cation transporter [Pelolinea sp.]
MSIPTSLVALNVLGMTCISCSAHVESALLNVPGVLEAEVSLAKASVKVTSIKGLVTTTDIEQAICSVGYKVESLKACSEIVSIENITA